MSRLLSVFEASAAGTAGMVGLEFGPATGPTTALTFGQLDARAARTAAVLMRRGLRPGDRLAYQLANRVEVIDLLLACLRLGVVLVPVNVLYRERELAHIALDAEPVAVVTTPDLVPLLPAGTAAWDVDALAEDAAL